MFSNLELQKQNFRLTNLLIYYVYWSGYQQVPVPVDYQSYQIVKCQKLEPESPQCHKVHIVPILNMINYDVSMKSVPTKSKNITKYKQSKDK